VSCTILGRITEASDEVCDDAEVVHSERMVVLCAIHELRKETMLVTAYSYERTRRIRLWLTKERESGLKRTPFSRCLMMSPLLGFLDVLPIAASDLWDSL
jgi:hypothetical protein